MLEKPFTNPNINWESLPTLEEAVFHPLSKEYRNVSYFTMAIWYLLFLGIVAIVWISRGSEAAFICLGIWLVLAILNIIRIQRSFRVMGYALRQHDIAFKRGVLVRRTTIVPYTRLQHAEISQGLLQQMVDISSLHLYTAGGSAADLTIPGLTPDEANRLRDYILNKIREINQPETITPIQQEEEA